MSDSLNEAGLSDLEKEFELEMEAEPEGETSEEELELETELELGADSQEVSDEELEFEVDEELELELNQKAEQFANSLYELSTKEFESEIEQETEVGKIIAEMEQEYFFKGLVDKLKTAGKTLIKKGLKLAPKFLGKIPVIGDAVKGATQLVRGNFKGALGSLAKAGLKAGLSAVPGVGTASSYCNECCRI